MAGYERRHAVICEVGLAGDYAGFDAFAVAVAGNETSFDPQAMAAS